MPDHMWIIPVSAGVSSIPQPIIEGQGLFLNVQWTGLSYPTSAAAAPLGLRAFNGFVPQTVPPGAGPASTVLETCHASWNWHSCGCDSTMTLGSQLLVGTVFGSALCNGGYNRLQAAVKYRVNETDRFSHAEISINDQRGNRAGANPFTASLVDNTWDVACTGIIQLPANLEDLDNLRVLATFLGTTTVANAGGTVVDLEWFMMHLWFEE